MKAFKSFIILIALLFLANTSLLAENSPTIISPKNGENSIPLQSEFIWESDTESQEFRIQVSNNMDFSNPMIDIAVVGENSVLIDLSQEGAYFWRVAQIDDNGEKWSEISAFKTESTYIPPKLNNQKIKFSGAETQDACNLIIPLDASFQSAMNKNDDGSAFFNLQFTFNFMGATYNSLYINNNGNVSFGQGYYNYVTYGFPNDDFKMIAPFWADVDTRPADGGLVYYKSEATRFTVIWQEVGYYNQQTDKKCTFELILTNGNDPIIGVGNNVCFSYCDMNWTTGSASGGINGFGGSPATVGMNKGDGSGNYRQIGRFDKNNYDYDGSGGDTDGVHWLDYKTFYFSDDYTPPVAACKDIELSLGEDGEVTISPEDVDNGSTDDRGVVHLSLSQSTFYCSDLNTTFDVTLTVTDNNYNVDACTANVTIVDDIAPEIFDCPDNISVYTGPDSEECGVYVSWDEPSATDNCEIAEFASNYNSGDFFPVGVSTVIYTAIDTYGNETECTFDINVIDNTAPVLSVELDPTVLWPPNHTLELINASITSSDNCTSDVTVVLSSITSNEVDSRNGGDPPDDIQGAEYDEYDDDFYLRAERFGNGMGREYTVTYTATDEYANSTVVSEIVSVPHDMDKKSYSDLEFYTGFIAASPNPFTEETEVEFRISEKSFVNIEIYDVFGNRIKQLANSVYKSGTYKVIWDGTNSKGTKSNSGVYYCKLSTKASSQFITLIINR